tara:strand:- start:590 stop:1267 length:678 start_codon:yes stop_codon:yes gene_type:complete
MELHNDKLIVGNGPETRTLNNPTSFQAVYGGKKSKRKTRKLKKRKGGSTPSSSSNSSMMTAENFLDASLKHYLPVDLDKKRINEMLEEETKSEIEELNKLSIPELENEKKTIQSLIQKIRKMKGAQKMILRNAELAGDKKAVNDLQSVNNRASSLGLEHHKNLQFYIDILGYINHRIKELKNPQVSKKANDESDRIMEELLAEEASRKKTTPPSTKKKKSKSKRK